MTHKRKVEEALTTCSGAHKRLCHQLSKPRKTNDSNASTTAGNSRKAARKESNAARAVARIFELVEAILVHLPVADIATCMGSNEFFEDVCKNSSLIQRRVFGLLPPDHDTVWELGRTPSSTTFPQRYIQTIPGKMRIEMALPSDSTRYIVPVTINETLLRPGGFTHKDTPDGARRGYGHPRFTDDEAYAFLAFLAADSRNGFHALKVDVAELPPDSDLRDMFLTKPPATQVQIRLANPEGLAWHAPSGRKWEGNYRSFVVTRAEGVRLRDLVAEVAEAGSAWSEQMNQRGVDSVMIRDEWTVPFGKWVFDFVQRQGMVYRPDYSKFDN